MPAVDVLIPWRTDEGPRVKALDRVVWEFEQCHSRWAVRLADCPEGPWSKGAALVTALGDAPIVVVHDADVWCDGIDRAAVAVQAGTAWAIPHGDVIRLTVDGGIEEKYRGLPGGGIVVLAREVFEDCPMDPRFQGWGGEDEAWGCALSTLHGEPWRGTADLVHLWHPPAPRVSRRFGNRANEALRQRYLQCNGNPVLMRQLVTEAANVSPPSLGARREAAAKA